jgi:hypothetical protein
MFRPRAVCIAWLLAMPAMLTAVGLADDAKTTKAADSAAAPPADAELLEYLGSEDAEGQEWMDYLARTDIAQAAQAAKAKKPPVTTGEEGK